MPTINWNSHGVIISDPIFQVDTINAAVAATWPAGTVLGRLTSTKKLDLFDAASSTGLQTPVAVLTDALTVAATTDVKQPVLISGKVRKGELKDKNGANTLIDVVAVDGLRSMTIIALPVTQLGIQDNQ